MTHIQYITELSACESSKQVHPPKKRGDDRGCENKAKGRKKGRKSLSMRSTSVITTTVAKNDHT